MDVSFFLFFFSRKNRRSRVCIIEVKKRNDTNTWIFFSQKKKNQSWQDGLSHLLYSLLAWQGFHHQGSRSLAHKQYFSLFTVPKSALACTRRIPYRNAWPGSRGRYPHHRREYRVTVDQFHPGLLNWAVAAKHEHSKQHDRNKVTRFSPVYWSTSSFKKIKEL